MKPEQKDKMQEKQTDKAKGDLAGKNVDAGLADHVRGGLRRGLADESPKESR